MTFKLHDWVRIKKLGKKGEIVNIIKPGLYQVSIGAMLMQCKEADLVLAQAPKLPPSPSHTISQETVGSKLFSSVNLNSLDLHGLTVVDALRKVEDRLNTAILAGVDRIEIVHGHGTGKIKKALHEYLRNSSVVTSFKLDDLNSGVTFVYL